MATTDYRLTLELAIELSKHCPPSPGAFSVGAIIVDSKGKEIATGYSRETDSTMHAEEVALHKARAAGHSLVNTTLVSSLEPCGKRLSGKTSCANHIIEAKIKHVVYALDEPPVFVTRSGEAKLRQAGVEVTVIPELGSLVEKINGLPHAVVAKLVATRLSTHWGTGQLHSYRENKTNQVHLALVYGHPTAISSPLVRVHSACLTGEALYSERCDCRWQLERSFELMHAQKNGVIIYLNQEGRGIGLIDKLRAYALQDQGLDTVEANIQLRHQADERNFEAAGAILKDLGLTAITLLTNNPEKINTLTQLGLAITRQPLWIEPNKINEKYLEAKRTKLNHLA